MMLAGVDAKRAHHVVAVSQLVCRYLTLRG